MTTGKLILELAKAIERLDDGQREHYRLLSKALLSCYVNDGQRAAVIVSREQDSSATLIAVNADNAQVTEMLLSHTKRPESSISNRHASSSPNLSFALLTA